MTITLEIFNQELNKVKLDEIKKLAKHANSAEDLAFNRSIIAKINRYYDAKDLLYHLAIAFFEDDTKILERAEKYGVSRLFETIVSVDNAYLEDYAQGDLEWFSRVCEALDEDLPLN